MDDCKYLKTEDVTPWHSDVYDHPDYKHTCEKCGKEVIPFLYCNERRCKNYTPAKEFMHCKMVLSKQGGSNES